MNDTSRACALFRPEEAALLEYLEDVRPIGGGEGGREGVGGGGGMRARNSWLQPQNKTPS